MFSLFGVLLAVAIVVWLGSQVIGGTSETTSTTPADSEVDALTDQIDQLGGLDATPGTPTPGEDLRVTDDGQLDDGGSVFVDGTGLTPGPYELTMCLTNEARTAGGLTGCDPATAMAVTVDDGGILDAGYQVTRVISIAGTSYDCGAFRSACVLVAHPPGDPSTGPSAPVVFADGLPPVDAARPPGG